MNNHILNKLNSDPFYINSATILQSNDIQSSLICKSYIKNFNKITDKLSEIEFDYLIRNSDFSIISDGHILLYYVLHYSNKLKLTIPNKSLEYLLANIEYRSFNNDKSNLFIEFINFFDTMTKPNQSSLFLVNTKILKSFITNLIEYSNFESKFKYNSSALLPLLLSPIKRINIITSKNLKSLLNKKNIYKLPDNQEYDYAMALMSELSDISFKVDNNTAFKILNNQDLNKVSPNNSTNATSLYFKNARDWNQLSDSNLNYLIRNSDLKVKDKDNLFPVNYLFNNCNIKLNNQEILTYVIKNSIDLDFSISPAIQYFKRDGEENINLNDYNLNLLIENFPLEDSSSRFGNVLSQYLNSIINDKFTFNPKVFNILLEENKLLLSHYAPHNFLLSLCDSKIEIPSSDIRLMLDNSYLKNFKYSIASLFTHSLLHKSAYYANHFIDYMNTKDPLFISSMVKELKSLNFNSVDFPEIHLNKSDLNKCNIFLTIILEQRSFNNSLASPKLIELTKKNKI